MMEFSEAFRKGFYLSVCKGKCGSCIEFAEAREAGAVGILCKKAGKTVLESDKACEKLVEG